MKSELARVLKERFHKKMASELPDFAKTGTAFGGIIYRRRDNASARNVFIFLEPDSKYDRFTLELAASASSEFPFDILPGEKPPSGAARYRIRSFLDPELDGWWRANESDELLDIAAFMNLGSKEKVDQAGARIPHLVEDAFKQLLAALPKFMALIEGGLPR